MDKAVDLLGIGTRQLRKLPTDGPTSGSRIDALEDAVAADRTAGFLPAIVVGNAGTVNTGAIDPLDATRRLLRAREAVVPRDGAYGALASIVPELAPLFAGMERADSIAADPHKWLYVPYEAGATLVREPGASPPPSASSRSTSRRTPRARSRARPGSPSAASSSRAASRR